MINSNSFLSKNFVNISGTTIDLKVKLCMCNNGGRLIRIMLLSGDVILSINGVSMEKADHNTLVSFIRNSGNLLR